VRCTFTDITTSIFSGRLISRVLEHAIQRRASGKLSHLISQLGAEGVGFIKWKDTSVVAPLVLSGVFAIVFVVVELFLTPEPVMAPFLLKQKIPVLVGLSNYLVALCNFSVMYFFPMWFQTVALTSASTAGEFCDCLG
jgi:hypothetical protein